MNTVERPVRMPDALPLQATLVDEGLEILAAYISIDDTATRLAIKRFIVALADANAAKVQPSLL